MNRLSTWLSLVSNIAVVIGIIVLVFEIRQNDQIMLEEQKLRQASAFREIESEFIEVNRQVADSPLLAELLARLVFTTSPKFTQTEIVILYNYIAQQARIDHTIYRFKLAGHISDAAWNKSVENVKSHLNSDSLFSRLYMRTFLAMPEDIVEHFNAGDYSEGRLDVSEFLLPDEKGT